MKELLIAFASATCLATVFVTLLGYRVRTPGQLPRPAAAPRSLPRRRQARRISAA